MTTDNTYLAARGLDRATRAPAPIDVQGNLSYAWASIPGLLDGASPNIVVAEETVRGLPALERAVRLVSHSVATMIVAGTADADEEVLRRPHPLFSAFEYYAMVIETAMKRGDFIAVIVSGQLGDGADAQLVPVHPDLVAIDGTTGFPVYTINRRRYEWWEIFHVRANAIPGSFRGCGIVEKFRVALSEQLHSQRYAETTYRTGGVPSGVVTVEQTGPVTQDQTDAVNDSWSTKFGHAQRKVAVLPSGLKFEPVSWSPHDAEFAESRRLTVAEAALMCDLRPEDLGASFGGTGLTYGNRTDDALQRIVDAYSPWTERLEQPLADLVGRPVVADPAGLLRLTPREAAEVEALEIANAAARNATTATDPTGEDPTA